MTDVVEIANARRDALAAEIGRLNYFIRMAEKLVKDNRAASNKAPATEDEKAAEPSDPETADSSGPATVHPLSATADGKDSDGKDSDGKDADGKGAEEEREDLSVRELEAGERVHQSRTIRKEPTPDRWRGLGHFHRVST